MFRTHRRLMLVNDSNSIGDFSTCAALLKQPQQGKLLAVIKNHLQLLITPLVSEDQMSVLTKLETIQQQLSLMQKVIPIDINCLFMVYDTLNMDLSNSCTTSYQCSNRR